MFDAITSAVDVTALATAVVAIAALKIVPMAARWASGKLVSTFGR